MTSYINFLVDAHVNLLAICKIEEILKQIYFIFQIYKRCNLRAEQLYYFGALGLRKKIIFYALINFFLF